MLRERAQSGAIRIFLLPPDAGSLLLRQMQKTRARYSMAGVDVRHGSGVLRFDGSGPPFNCFVFFCWWSQLPLRERVLRRIPERVNAAVFWEDCDVEAIFAGSFLR